MGNSNFGKKLRRVENSEVTPPTPEHSYCSGFKPKVKGMNSSGQHQFNGPEDVVSVPIEKGGENNPPHPPPGTCSARVQDAIKAGCRNEEAILQWCAVYVGNASKTN